MLLSENKLYLSVLITTYIYLLLCMWFMVSRPQVVTYIMILIEILVLEKYSRTEKWYYLIPMPIISLILINYHASMWWMLFAFLLPYIVETVNIKWLSLNPRSIKRMPIYISSLLMFIMGFINPYGYKLILYVFTSFGNASINQSILEMGAPDVKTVNGIIYFVTLFFVIFCYVLNKDGNIKLRYILLAIGTCGLSLMALKSIPYFLFGTVITLCHNLKNMGDKLVFRIDSKKTFITISIFIILIYLISISLIIKDYDESKDFPETKNAIAYLNENTDEKNVSLYTSFFDGGYAEYRGFKTYIDARAEVFLQSNNQQKDVFEEYISLQSGELHYQEFLNMYSFTHILVTKDDILNVYLLKDDNYAVLYEDEKSKIFIPVNN